MATWATAMASPALTPSQGAAEAWALLPPKWTSKWETARQVPSRRSAGQGWTIMAACTSSNDPALEHGDLAAAALLGRVPEHPHGEAQLVGHLGQSEAGPDGRGGDDVVAAGMADAGEGVVLGADGHDQRARPDARH